MQGLSPAAGPPKGVLAGSTPPLLGTLDWVENYRMAWEKRLDRLRDYLGGLEAKEKKHGGNNK
jgi:hypothetical protein